MTENQKVLVNELKELNRRSNELLELLLEEFDKTEEMLQDTEFTSEADRIDEIIVTRYLHELGMMTHLKGFAYSRTAIILCIQDKSYLETITKRLYPKVAEIHNTTPTKVERAIRNAIETLARNTDSKKCYELWEGRKPTNSEFFARMVEKYEVM